MAQKCLMENKTRLNEASYSRCPTLPGRRGQGKLSIEKGFSIGGLSGMFKQPLIHARDARESNLEAIGAKLWRNRDGCCWVDMAEAK